MALTEAKTRPTIRVLPRELAEKIAAGEVVERPGSVIKELVENSLDAGATKIRVDLEDGGRKKISVWDNGHGIAADQVLTALERHATSKITELDDLWNLATMGFRGEALPSIAAVSRFTLETRTPHDKGRRVYLEGAKLLKDEPAQAPTLNPSGTILTIEDLFFNVPARLKFLRAKASESGFIRELLERIALCNPHVEFSLYSEGRRTLLLPSAQTEATRLAAILETKSEDIEEFESMFEGIHVRGWLDRNGRASNSRYIYLAVNGRMVRDKLLQQAILVALRPRMMEGEYPRIFVEVNVPRDQVDVNVHPAKSEVRFQKSRDVFQLIHGALEHLARTPSRPFYSAPLPDNTVASTPLPPLPPQQEQKPLFTSTGVQYREKTDTLWNQIPSTDSATETVPVTETVTVTEAGDQSPDTGIFSSLHYIGQLKNTYLLFQDDEGLVLIDQHAAHERINYERIKDDFMKNGLHPQPLLVSTVVKCKPDEVALALDADEAFKRLGFEFEAFGESSLVIRSAPEGLAPDRAGELFRSLLTELSDSETADLLVKDPSRLSPKLERWLSTAACHGSVRAGQPLAPKEAKELATQMETTPSSLNCPHGRPSSIRMTFGQIEGLFKRG